ARSPAYCCSPLRDIRQSVLGGNGQFWRTEQGHGMVVAAQAQVPQEVVAAMRDQRFLCGKSLLGRGPSPSRPDVMAALTYVCGTFTYCCLSVAERRVAMCDDHPGISRRTFVHGGLLVVASAGCGC